MFADVALNAPLRAGDRVFTFAVPAELAPQIAPGAAVRVPFGRQTATGFVVALRAESGRAVKPILAIDGRLPAMPADLIALAVWMAEYYVCSVGEALWTMIPPLAAARPTAAARPAPPTPQASPLGAVAAGLDGKDTGLAALLGSPAARVLLLADAARFAGYRDALRWLEQTDGGAIFLVPEVVQAEALAAWIGRHTALPWAVLHGGLPDADRWRLFRRIAEGAVRIVVGTRSAVFAPLPRLGLLVIDREEDTGYKEERTPRYHARRVAEERALRAGAALVWGTAAPSLEVMREVLEGRGRALRLDERRASVAIVDARADRDPAAGLFGRQLYRALQRVLPEERAILFVPRRGYADFLLCEECGWVPRCERCDVAMTYHLRRRRLQCHLCGSNAPVPEVCRVCGGTALRPHGIGTERVEAAARRLFRACPIHRLDTGAAPDEAAQRRVWEEFARRGGLLIGTQLLVKGVGQRTAAVVGAIGVDAALNLPDFRAAERLYQVLTRLVPLARREAIVQTFTPAHPVFRALGGEAESFYRTELAARAAFRYPPYRTLVNVVVSGRDPDAAREAAGRIGAAIAGGEVLGPSPAPLARVRGRYRWQLLVKEDPPMAARAALAAALRELAPAREPKVVVDVDPVEVL